MPKAIVVPDLGYVSTKTRGRVTAQRHLRGKLKYFTYRDDRQKHLRAHERGRRWQDRGLGSDYTTILKRCDRLRSPHVLAWTWVISPDPALLALVPEGQRRDVLADLTERVVEEYYLARGAEVPEYSYVLHDRLTSGTDGTPAGLPHLHTHVILPGTAPTLEGQAFYNNKRQGDDRLLREVATAAFEAELDERLDPAWRRSRELPDPSDSLDRWFPRER